MLSSKKKKKSVRSCYTFKCIPEYNFNLLYQENDVFDIYFLLMVEFTEFPLRKHAFSNILKILPPKKWKFSDKNSDIFLISAQNIDCGYLLEPPRRGGSNEYQQSMFLSRNKKNNVYPCKPQFYYIKVEFKGAKLYRYVFVMHWTFFDNCLFNEPF